MTFGFIKKYLLLFFSIFLLNTLWSQTSNVNSKTNVVQTNLAYKDGEFLKYRIHYGFINAGFATLKLKTAFRNGQELFYASGKGWTTGAAKMFFVVNDTYESYFTKGNVKPVFHKRRVDEDGYLIRRDKYFDFNNKTVTVDDLEKNTKTVYPIDNVQDMVSALYYLRNLDLSNIREGSEFTVNLFFDGESFPFMLKFLERENIKTKFGTVKTWKIQPMVQKGRIFESKESLTIWVTDDANKLPIRIKASLIVGSLKADLEGFSGLANSFPIIVD